MHTKNRTVINNRTAIQLLNTNLQNYLLERKAMQNKPLFVPTGNQNKLCVITIITLPANPQYVTDIVTGGPFNLYFGIAMVQISF